MRESNFSKRDTRVLLTLLSLSSRDVENRVYEFSFAVNWNCRASVVNYILGYAYRYELRYSEQVKRKNEKNKWRFGSVACGATYGFVANVQESKFVGNRENTIVDFTRLFVRARQKGVLVRFESRYVEDLDNGRCDVRIARETLKNVRISEFFGQREARPTISSCFFHVKYVR